jgi:hypothetical protein
VIRDAFYRQGPFTGSGGYYSPGPATGSPLLAMVRPLDGTLAPPWVFVRTSPFVNRELRPKPRHTLRSPHPPMVSPTAVHFELGPRSLDPAAVFSARMPSLFEARCRLTTSATAYRRAGNQTNRLSFPRRDGDLDLLPFLYAPRRSSLSSGTRRAALRSLPTIPVPVRPVTRFAWPRYLESRPTTAEFPRRCIVRINVHGSKDRVKDASRIRMRRCPVPASGACAYVA